MDLRFARSRRRAARVRPRRRSWPRARSARVALAAAALLALAGELTALDIVADTQRPEKSAATKPYLCPIPPQYRRAFVAASEETGVPLNLLVALAYEESRMDHRALSEAGAQGLLQLLPATAHELELDPKDPTANVLAGARYLKRMWGEFASLDLALAAYNAGPTAVQKAGGAPSPQTLTYVANVKARAVQMAGCR